MAFSDWVSARDLRAIYAAELIATKKDTLEDVALYWATSGGAWDGAHNFKKLIQKGPTITHLAQGLDKKTSLPSYGKLVAAGVENLWADSDRLISLDDLTNNYILLGRPITIKAGGPGLAYADWEVVISGVMEAASLDNKTISIAIKSKLAELLETQIPPNEYESGGSIPDSIDGRSIPLVLGRCWNISPILINESTGLYQFNDPEFGPVQAVDTVRIDGAEVTGLTVDLDAGTILSPGGRPTLDVRGRVSTALGGYVELLGDLVNDALRTFASATAADLDTAAFTAFNTARPYAAGIYLTNKYTIKRVIDNLLTGTLSHFGNNRAGGLWSLYGWDAPAGAPALEIAGRDIKRDSYKREPDTNSPAWKVTIEGARNWTPTNSFDASVSEADKEWLKESFASQAASDAAISAAYDGKAKELGPHQTCLANKADLASLANLWLAMYGTERNKHTLTTRLGGLLCAPGDAVQVTRRRHEMSDGVLLRALGSSEDHAAREMKLTLWG